MYNNKNMNPLITLFFLLVISIKSFAQDDGRLIRIPVIVHLLYTDSLQDNGVTLHSRLNGNSSRFIPDSKIIAEIEDLNRDFQRMNPDTTAVIREYQHVIGNPRVSFVLQEIRRVKVTQSDIEKPQSNSSLLHSLSPAIDTGIALNVYLSIIKYNGKPTNGVPPVRGR
jgi:hypothetical protein